MATICSNTQESINQYNDYVNTHIRNIRTAYNKYANVLEKVLGIDKKELLERVLNHDKSKWSKEEFEAYRKKFYPVEGEENLNNTDFDKAWFHHLRNNDHHPEYWSYIDDKVAKLIDMPNICIAEMILDWATFSILKNDDNEFIKYWESNKYIKPFSNYTRSKVEKVMDTIKEGKELWV